MLSKWSFFISADKDETMSATAISAPTIKDILIPELIEKLTVSGIILENDFHIIK